MLQIANIRKNAKEIAERLAIRGLDGDALMSSVLEMDESTGRDTKRMRSNQHHSQVTLNTIPFLFREFSPRSYAGVARLRSACTSGSPCTVFDLNKLKPGLSTEHSQRPGFRVVRRVCAFTCLSGLVIRDTGPSVSVIRYAPSRYESRPVSRVGRI